MSLTEKIKQTLIELQKEGPNLINFYMSNEIFKVVLEENIVRQRLSFVVDPENIDSPTLFGIPIIKAEVNDLLIAYLRNGELRFKIIKFTEEEIE